MSQKVAKMRAAIANPLNTHNFLVNIPEFGEYNFLVQSAALPGVSARSTQLFIAGEPVAWPTVPEYGHVWSCKLPENDAGTMRKLIDQLWAKYWDEKTGKMLVNALNPFQTISVTMRDLNDNPVFSFYLRNAWLEGWDDISLDQSQPATSAVWSLKFHYDYFDKGTE